VCPDWASWACGGEVCQEVQVASHVFSSI
jgi:hypothetical protein